MERINEQEIHVGQSVILKPLSSYYGKEPRQGTITKIGRKYFYVDIGSGETIAFEIDSFREKPSIYTQSWEFSPCKQEFADTEEWRYLCCEVKKYFRAWNDCNELTLEQLRQIAGILELGCDNA